MVVVQFKTLVPDNPAHASLATILKWCDSAQGALFDPIPDPSMRKEMQEWCMKGAVTRANVVELLVTAAEWEMLIDVVARSRVCPVITRVGRTSWVVRFSVETLRGQVLAQVQTVMVAVDANDFTRSVPVPFTEALQSLVHEQPGLEAPVACSRPHEAFAWRTEVRQSDCDAMQHINNAVYASLAEDARHAAVQAGALTDLRAVSGSLRKASIDYLGQPQAGDALVVAVWWDAGRGTIGLEFSSCGDVVARVVLDVNEVSARSSL